jgi:hypothetical protein
MENMKTIKLTESQKNKLLEMCKALFPDYTRYVGFYITEDYKFYKEKIYEFNLLHLIGDRDIKIIHWFEFCMTHLRTKLKLHHDDMYLTMNPGMSTFKHPVDYLYEQFKKLEL